MTTRPSPPRELTVSNQGATFLTLSWLTPDSDGGSSITGYRVRQYAGNSTSFTSIPVDKDNLTVNINGLTPESSYTFTVQAINNSSDNGGYSDQSGSQTVTLTQAPSAPKSLEFSDAGPTSLTLSWLPPNDDGGSPITDYRVSQSRSDNPNNPTFIFGNSLTRNIKNLSPGWTYTFTVQAINGARQNSGHSPDSDPLVVKMLSGVTIRVNGIWVQAYTFVRVAGYWQPATPWVRENGIWMQTHYEK